MTKKEEEPKDTTTQDLVTQLNARIRLSEERQNELRRKVLIIEQNMLAGSKKITQDTRLLTGEISEIKQKIRNIEERIITVIKELQLTPKKEDVEMVKKYIDYWNPIKFINIDKIDEIVKESLEKIKKEEEEKP